MFLRNIGASYDLAIIDRHVIAYMGAIGLAPDVRACIGNLSGYGRHETLLQKHANGLGYPVGLLDWAIWIVMRVAGRVDAEAKYA
jgi:N-glycosylase/DNA lyase